MSKLLGTYRLGDTWVRVFVCPNELGGSVFPRPHDKGTPKVTVGLNYPWPKVISILLHEALELTFSSLSCRLNYDANWISGNAAEYTFLMDHQQFTEAVARVGEFLTEVVPPLQKAHTTFTRKKK